MARPLSVRRRLLASDEDVVGRPQAEHVRDPAQVLAEIDLVEFGSQIRQVILGQEHVVPRVAERPQEALEARVAPQARLGPLAPSPRKETP